MNTYSIRHEVVIKSAPHVVYEAVTDTRKLAGWWTADVRGNGAEVGGSLEFRCGDHCKKFAVVELQPDRLARWQAIAGEGADEWDGTEIAFSLSTDEKQCRVDFRHSGWRRENGWLPHCSTK